jgi:predicted nucleic-acid-binding Zn-ribbon protein
MIIEINIPVCKNLHANSFGNNNIIKSGKKMKALKLIKVNYWPGITCNLCDGPSLRHAAPIQHQN